MHNGHLILACLFGWVLFVVSMFEYVPCSKHYGISNKLDCMVERGVPFNLDDKLTQLWR